MEACFSSATRWRWPRTPAPGPARRPLRPQRAEGDVVVARVVEQHDMLADVGDVPAQRAECLIVERHAVAQTDTAAVRRHEARVPLRLRSSRCS
jgi:hypothetical protein